MHGVYWVCVGEDIVGIFTDAKQAKLFAAHVGGEVEYVGDEPADPIHSGFTATMPVG